MSVCYRVGLRGLVKRLCPAWIPRAVEIQVQAQPPTMSKKEKKKEKSITPPPPNWSHQPKPCKQILGDCISPNPDGPLAGKYEVNPPTIALLTTGTRHPAYSNTSRHRTHCSPDKRIPKKKKKKNPPTDVSFEWKEKKQHSNKTTRASPIGAPAPALQGAAESEER